MQRLLFAFAFLASLGAHFALAGLSKPREVATLGGDVAGEIALGSSFANLAAGTLESTRPDGEIDPTPAQDVDPSKTPPTPTTEQPSPPKTQPIKTQSQPLSSQTSTREVLRPGALDPIAAAKPPAPQPTVKTEQAIDVAVLAQSEASEPTRLEPVSSQTPQIEPSQPREALAAAQASQAIEPENAPLEPPEIVSQQPSQSEVAPVAQTVERAPTEARDTIRLTASMRPVMRTTPRPKEAAPAPAPARRGNSEVNAARGQSSGTQDGTQAQTTPAAKTTARRAGQAEINSYNARVATRITRAVSRLRARGNSGDVRVAIVISASGGLAQAQVLKSSGNATADALAVEAVRKAAPFGEPPSRNSTQLKLTIQVGNK